MFTFLLHPKAKQKIQIQGQFDALSRLGFQASLLSGRGFVHLISCPSRRSGEGALLRFPQAAQQQASAFVAWLCTGRHCHATADSHFQFAADATSISFTRYRAQLIHLDHSTLPGLPRGGTSIRSPRHSGSTVFSSKHIHSQIPPLQHTRRRDGGSGSAGTLG